MPKISTAVTTTTTLELTPALKTLLKKKIGEYATAHATSKDAEARKDVVKEEIEQAFADAGQYDAINSDDGVVVRTTMGEVPIKIVKPEPGQGKLNEVKLMKAHGLTPADLDKCRDKAKPKQSYLGIYLPKGKKEDE